MSLSGSGLGLRRLLGIFDLVLLLVIVANNIRHQSKKVTRQVTRILATQKRFTARADKNQHERLAENVSQRGQRLPR